MIASHYAEPAERVVAATAELRGAPSAAAEIIGEIAAGAKFRMLDDSLGWAWGYAGADGRVGYVPSEALSRQ